MEGLHGGLADQEADLPQLMLPPNVKIMSYRLSPGARLSSGGLSLTGVCQVCPEATKCVKTFGASASGVARELVKRFEK